MCVVTTVAPPHTVVRGSVCARRCSTPPRRDAAHREESRGSSSRVNKPNAERQSHTGGSRTRRARALARALARSLALSLALPRYAAARCSVVVADTIANCTTAPGVGRALAWRVTVGAQVLRER